MAQAAELPKWQAEWQRTIEAAKKEGQLSLYGGQEITHPEIIAAFNKEFPFIKITSASGRAADMMRRIVAERRADKYLADITASGLNGPRMLYLNKILDSGSRLLPNLLFAFRGLLAKTLMIPWSLVRYVTIISASPYGIALSTIPSVR